MLQTMYLVFILSTSESQVGKKNQVIGNSSLHNSLHSLALIGIKNEDHYLVYISYKVTYYSLLLVEIHHRPSRNLPTLQLLHCLIELT